MSMLGPKTTSFGGQCRPNERQQPQRKAGNDVKKVSLWDSGESVRSDFWHFGRSASVMFLDKSDCPQLHTLGVIPAEMTAHVRVIGGRWQSYARRLNLMESNSSKRMAEDWGARSRKRKGRG